MITQNQEHLVLESDSLRVIVTPQNGGKIVSFYSKKTGQELFFQDFRTGLDPARGYSFHDISGLDECFPTVLACVSAVDGRPFADHGFLWQKAWKTVIRGDIAVLSVVVPEIECTFERSCQLIDSDCLELRYQIKNYGAACVPYVYSAHPLLRCGEQTKLELPSSLHAVFNCLCSENYGVAEKTWIKLPFKNTEELTGPFDKNKDTWVKFFTERLKEGRAVIHHCDFGESLEITFDEAQLPYMGILISQGADLNNDGNFKQRFFFAIEPTTGIGDDLKTCEVTQTMRQLESGQETSFWIRFRLFSS